MKKFFLFSLFLLASAHTWAMDDCLKKNHKCSEKNNAQFKEQIKKESQKFRQVKEGIIKLRQQAEEIEKLSKMIVSTQKLFKQDEIKLKQEVLKKRYDDIAKDFHRMQNQLFSTTKCRVYDYGTVNCINDYSRINCFRCIKGVEDNFNNIYEDIFADFDKE